VEAEGKTGQVFKKVEKEKAASGSEGEKKMLGDSCSRAG